MHRADRFIGILFLIFGSYLVFRSREFPYWQDFGPGPGYFPFWLGMIMNVLSAFLLVRVFLFSREKKEKGIGLQRGILYPLTVLLVMFVCFFLMRYLGFVVPVLLFILILMEFLERGKRKLHVGITILTGFILYYVFAYWMGIPFPTGILGI
jgi:putative tricarboxylic transport membrane protein